MEPLHAIQAMWAAWVISWFIAASWSAPTQARPPLHRVLLDRALTGIGAFLLFTRRPDAPLHVQPLWSIDESTGWLLAALTAAGFVFCWWARIHLGRLWSGAVTRKQDHHIVDSGPYRIVRHPIYTGIILASFATATAIGTAGSLLGAVIMSLGWYVKARVEERFLREQLGAQAYDLYASRTAMLVPFVRF